VSAGRSIDARLMAVLHSRGELSRHCQAIRRYLLMGQVGVCCSTVMLLTVCLRLAELAGVQCEFKHYSLLDLLLTIL
jgi:hypothetical protein